MIECVAKNAIRTLIEQATSMALASNTPLHELRGTAFYNMERDAIVIALEPFDRAVQEITAVPNFVGRFGTEAATRIVLQFVYEYFKRVDSVAYQEAVFEDLWCDFEVEAADAYWVVRGIANIRNFKSDTNLLDLGDGITIRGRSPDDLASLGFGASIWDRIAEDWHGPGASSFVLVAEYSHLKQPDNLILLDSYQVSVKATRAIWSLRLSDAGSISIGPMWVVRAARFNVGLGGLHSVGASIPAFGVSYNWTEKTAVTYPSIYRALAKLETAGYEKSPGNLQVALRAFMATYDRWPAFPDSQIIDAITAIEALLGTETEISFRLSFRVASLLASSDEHRGTLFKLMRDFYDTRSKIVHGASLGEKQQRLLHRMDDLCSVVRQLIRSFVLFAHSPSEGYDRKFWRERLDVAFLDAAEREKLRIALGLSSGN